MKYTVQTIRREYDRLDRILGIDTSAVSITVSTRAVRKLGCCKYVGNTPTEIRITDFVLECEEQFWDTIRHEYAHAAAFLLDGENHGHDEYWKGICRRIGCNPERCVKSSQELTAAKNAVGASGRIRAYKYALHCPVCGRIFKYKTAGKFVRYAQAGQLNRMACPCGASAFRLETF